MYSAGRHVAESSAHATAATLTAAMNAMRFMAVRRYFFIASRDIASWDIAS